MFYTSFAALCYRSNGLKRPAAYADVLQIARISMSKRSLECLIVDSSSCGLLDCSLNCLVWSTLHDVTIQELVRTHQ